METLTLLDAVGAAFGLLYLYLEYAADARLWVVSMVMPAIDLFVYYQAGLYADFAMAIYYLLAAVYGWAVWTHKSNENSPVKNEKKRNQRPITHTPLCTALRLSLVFLGLWAAMYMLLVRFTNSNVPLTDSLGNALSIVALWMLAQKYVEQWLVWFVVDGLFFALYIYKGVPFHGALYGFYTVMAIVGYRRWLALMHHKTNESPIPNT